MTAIIERYGTVIVLEDDLVTNRYFLRFMNDALEMCIRDRLYPDLLEKKRDDVCAAE